MHSVVLLSGGLDSTVLLHHMLTLGTVTGLSVDYGQRHIREIASAELIAQRAGVPLIQIQLGVALSPIFALSQSSQVGSYKPIPSGHYADESMKATIVPNRNMLLIAVAGALADSIRADSVGYAAHAGDHAIYPDCRPEFAVVCSHTLFLATGVRLVRPFIDLTKTDIVRLGASLGAPLELTYSCYRGEAQHCGICGTCFEWREAFRDAGVPDPTSYDTVTA